MSFDPFYLPGPEYVRARVVVKKSGVVVDPTGDTVTMAFVAPGAVPAIGDWKVSSWETDTTTTPDTYWARCLVGTAVTLTADDYSVFVKIADSPETPVKRCPGLLSVL